MKMSFEERQAYKLGYLKGLIDGNKKLNEDSVESSFDEEYSKDCVNEVITEQDPQLKDS